MKSCLHYSFLDISTKVTLLIWYDTFYVAEIDRLIIVSNLGHNKFVFRGEGEARLLQRRESAVLLIIL